jgi:hypothetical protein
LIYAERIHMQSFSQQLSYAIIRFLGCISDQLCNQCLSLLQMSLMAAHGEIYTLRDNVKNNQIIVKYLIDLFLIYILY